MIDISVHLLCEILGDIKTMDAESTRQAFESLIEKMSKDERLRYEDIRPSVSGVTRFLQERRYNDDENRGFDFKREFDILCERYKLIDDEKGRYTFDCNGVPVILSVEGIECEDELFLNTLVEVIG